MGQGYLPGCLFCYSIGALKGARSVIAAGALFSSSIFNRNQFDVEVQLLACHLVVGIKGDVLAVHGGDAHREGVTVVIPQEDALPKSQVLGAGKLCDLQRDEWISTTSPGSISTTALSKPGIIMPVPLTKESGSPRSYEESNCVPSLKVPL